MTSSNDDFIAAPSNEFADPATRPDPSAAAVTPDPYAPAASSPDSPESPDSPDSPASPDSPPEPEPLGSDAMAGMDIEHEPDADGYWRDEFGNRVDHEGRRVDEDGNPVGADGERIDPTDGPIGIVPPIPPNTR